MTTPTPTTPTTSPTSPAPTAKFVTGSVLRHVLRMTAASSVGLAAMFAVDVVSLLYISLLGQKELTAAIGYAATLLFFVSSVSIGLSIACTALTSRALGSGDRDKARSLAGASLLLMVVIMVIASLALFPALSTCLSLLGAQGETHALALRYTRMVLPSAPLIGIGMCCSALLRSVGDARRAMSLTLISAVATSLLDPLFIFGFGLGLDGAAASAWCSRLILVAVGAWALLRVHKLLVWPSPAVLRQTASGFMAIGLPAVLTQVATPVGNAFTTHAIAPFGDEAIAGWAVVTRLIPVAFVVLFALSGSIGPIIGQNLGAQRLDRVRQTIWESMRVVVVYVLLMWLVLALASGLIADAFSAQGTAREVIEFFCLFVAGSFIFNGVLFVANASFNNLGYAFYSTALNWGRSTIGVVPFVGLGAHYYGINGIIAGYGLGVVAFGVAGGWLCFRTLTTMANKAKTSS